MSAYIIERGGIPREAEQETAPLFCTFVSGYAAVFCNLTEI